ncbi:YbhB/YbcL family Raf kinase inhibitor-like protein [Acidianus manzaensis]|uniref:Phosphatidylethanolamine-binding protein n=1 Tax=Acidianus manzaensis TaxID=282676 RepID=A0A1W6JZN8_9CREN|nr:YbhB/YbcL family Raf kinase inhibitor-like protein [Acidianus manzaensis]ARM75680.1 phosphatidylethanolamine-binding protein [Acidianus manzaensis]
MQIKSVFKEEEVIPKKYTCDGEDISPPLEWDKIDNARSYAIIVEDPDAPSGTFIHWVIYNIKQNSLPENIEKKENTKYGVQGLNDFDRVGYNGPCPPRSHGFHRYYFNVYALDTEINSKHKITADELKELMQGHIISSGSIMGKYKRM